MTMQPRVAFVTEIKCHGIDGAAYPGLPKYFEELKCIGLILYLRENLQWYEALDNKPPEW
jgi:hypothetical protein